MKSALFFLMVTALPTFCMNRAGTVNFTRNFVPYAITNQALIKSLADRKQQLSCQNTLNQKNIPSCVIIHKKAGMFHKVDSTSFYYSFKIKEKIDNVQPAHNHSCDPCGHDSILDDIAYVSLRPIYHADESTSWQGHE
jgi:hypothetical protein